MKHAKINGTLFSQMMREGANNLKINVDKINALNVFPVPDGDTGTNMNLSFTSGMNEMNKVDSVYISEVTKALSKGLLMGARGNSGVILSQLFRGFSKAIENNQELSAKQFASALQSGVETAYKAVMKPVEGTILTVAKDAAHIAQSKAKTTEDLGELMEAIYTEAKASLVRTPELLPVLKKVGVVDSGGQGLLYIYEGFLQVLKGKAVETKVDGEEKGIENTFIESKDEHIRDEVAEMRAAGVLSVDDITYGYCTEFLIRLDKQKSSTFDESQFRNQLDQFGDSLLVIADDELVKVHIHAEQLGHVLGFAQEHGSLTNIKIDNMREQFTALEEDHKDKGDRSEKPDKGDPKEYGIITVSPGTGITQIFKSLGADVVISGGQTMNPSTQEFVEAMNSIQAEKIIILPNNSNIILAAEQSAEWADVPVVVIPSKNVPQGMAALLSFNPSASLQENQDFMIDAKDQVKSGQVTYAVRDTEIGNVQVKKGDYLGIMDGEIVISTREVNESAKKLLDQMIDAESEIVTLIYGDDIEQDQVASLETYVEEHYNEVEIEIHQGGQPLYPYFISVE